MKSIRGARRPLSRMRRRAALLFRHNRVMPLIEAATLAAAIAIFAASYFIVAGQGSPTRQLSPPLVALLLVANLVPAMGLLVLLARRIAKGRAARSAMAGGGRLHVRLVAWFAVIASVPTLLVVIFASLLFQYGVEFWFSDPTRTVLENADQVAQAYVDEARQRIDGDMRPMAGDFRNALSEAPLDDPRFPSFLLTQLANRGLSEVALIGVAGDGVPRLLAFSNLDTKRSASELMPIPLLPRLDRGEVAIAAVTDRTEARIAVDPRADLYLYASRHLDPVVLKQVSRARSALGDYTSLLERSRTLQIQFNAALLVVSLLIVAIAISIALSVADRLVRPVSDLVGAARRVAAGDLSARVEAPRRLDEVGMLASAFNRMTRRIEEQTGALDSRRAFTEAVLSAVSAGVVSVDRQRRIRLINRSAEALLHATGGSPVGTSLDTVAVELARLLDGDERDAVVQVAGGGDPRTLAVRIVRTEDGHVLTFDDITQQLADQRRAAWADVARRIAHEIKNPLTPIQLAAERLQRRYGQEVQSDPTTFERLTATIVRQVGDLRRMVDEFSSFARMPKPVFRQEAVVDIARQALFLHEVAHPGIAFALEAPDPSPLLVCDRRQLGQALTNIVKNAAEAIAQKPENNGRSAPSGDIRMMIGESDGRLIVSVSDDGIGLPADRERITEPYVTTRSRGTGLGLAIVKRIVEDHAGTMTFADRPGGGSIVQLSFDVATLEPLASNASDGWQDNEKAGLPELARMRDG